MVIENSAAPRSVKHRGLQALRGLAALAVFVHHLPWLTSKVVPGQSFISSLGLGAMGVYVFFALSGYLMTFKVSADPMKFITDRCRRIFPALWAALLISAAITWTMGGGFAVDPRLFFLYPSGRILDTTVPYWTLLYELAFYVLVFAAIVISRRHTVLIVTGALIVSYALAPRPYVWSEVAYAGWPQLLFSSFGVYFLAGVAVTRLAPSANPSHAPAYALAGCLLYASESLAGWLGLPYPVNLLSNGALPHLAGAAGAALILMASLSWKAEGLLGRALYVVGDASYGVYLTHIGFMFLAYFLLSKTAATGWTYYLVMLLIAAFSFPLSMAFGWIDAKAQDWLKLAGRGRTAAPAVKPA